MANDSFHFHIYTSSSRHVLNQPKAQPFLRRIINLHDRYRPI